MDIRENLLNINKELPSAVKLVAVSKFHPAEAIVEAWNAGQRVFGESRPQEFYSKVQALSMPQDEERLAKPLCPGIEWHFIGHLQTNKLKLVLPYVSLVQSVDTVRLLEAIDRWGRDNARVTDILLECHIAGEQTKQGFSEDEVMQIVCGSRNYPNVRLRGLMGMATFTDDEAIIRADFARISTLYRKILALRDIPSPSGNGLSAFTELSIGMSGDWRIALEYGATMVRIGTTIFGTRNY